MQDEQKHIMIQWKGDNLKEVIDFTGNINFDKWFTSFEDYEKYVHKHNDIFKLFNEDGSHYEVPVGAWIVKTPDGCNVASKAIFKQKPIEQDTEIRDLWVYIREWNDKFGRLPKDEDELAACIDYVMKRQKTVDKVEPKFNVGDWVRAISSGNIFKILSVNDGLYRVLCHDGVEANYPIEEVEKDLVHWTLQDAKDGDVLCGYPTDVYPWIGIFHELNDDDSFKSYCYLQAGITGKFCPPSGVNIFGRRNVDCHNSENMVPATKEQCDLFFSKMKEAGYKWDSEKKELKKIEQNPTDMIEAKFKVGDWITNGKLLVGQVTSFDGEYYHYMCDGLEQPLHISNADKWHLWDIRQDANDGDILIYPDGTLTIFKEMVDEGLYLSYLVREPHLLRFNSTCTILNCYPATKEQCDLLFKKMHKAGYKWDANTKRVIHLYDINCKKGPLAQFG